MSRRLFENPTEEVKMDLGLMDKPVLVMAASSGIGRGVALEFARENARVMLFGRSEERLRKARDEIVELTGARVEFTPGDIRKREDIEKVVERTVSLFGSIYALFNNTGGPPAGKFDDFEDEDWVDAFELTLLGYVRTIRAVLPVMRGAGEGRIVNNTSSSIKQVIDNLILSNAFRTGIMGLSKTLARELAGDGILINVVGAGRIATERLDYLDSLGAEREGISLEEYQKRFARNIPIGRYGKAEELARLVVFLCSGANTYITGQSILIDGGMITAY